MKRLQQLTLTPTERVMPPFDPPKPTLASGLQTAFKVCDELFATERYQAGMRNAFYLRCQFHDQDPMVHSRIWLRYSAKRMGVMKLTAESGAGLSLGQLASDLDVDVPTEEDVDEGMSSEDEDAE